MDASNWNKRANTMQARINAWLAAVNDPAKQLALARHEIEWCERCEAMTTWRAIEKFTHVCAVCCPPVK